MYCKSLLNSKYIYFTGILIYHAITTTHPPLCQPFVSKALKNQQQYQTSLRQWEEEMALEGRPELIRREFREIKAKRKSNKKTTATTTATTTVTTTATTAAAAK